VTRDLYAAREAAGAPIEFEAEDVAIHDATGDAPFVTFTDRGRDPAARLRFHRGLRRVPRRQPPDASRRRPREYEKVYPFGWLGVLSRRRR
jgi:p-hydroxybenzoate 3-monooxygenase